MRHYKTLAPVAKQDEGIVHALWKHKGNMNKARVAEAARGTIQMKCPHEVPEGYLIVVNRRLLVSWNSRGK